MQNSHHQKYITNRRNVEKSNRNILNVVLDFLHFDKCLIIITWKKVNKSIILTIISSKKNKLKLSRPDCEMNLMFKKNLGQEKIDVYNDAK